MATRNRTVVFGMNSLLGVRQFLPEVLATVQERGFRVVVVAPEPAGQDENLQVTCPGVEFRYVRMRREIAPISDLRALWRVWSVLRSIQPDITNMSTPKMALIGGLAAWMASVPNRIYTLRGLRYETTGSWKRALLRTCEKVACACAHRVICISRSVRQAAARDRIAPPSKLELLGERGSEGITIPPGDRRATSGSIEGMRAQLGIPGQAVVIGFVGRLTRDKGVGELVQCVKILRGEGRPVHLLLLGDFESGDPVNEDTAAWIRTNPAVHWLGFVPNPEPYYGIMDFFVFPTYREGLPRVVLEAAAAGIPVVSTTATGVVDVVSDGLTGLLVPPGDAAALAEAVDRLLEEPEMARRMSRAATQTIREHFDNSYYLAKLADVLESMAGTSQERALRPSLFEAPPA